MTRPDDPKAPIVIPQELIAACLGVLARVGPVLLPTLLGALVPVVRPFVLGALDRPTRLALLGLAEDMLRDPGDVLR